MSADADIRGFFSRVPARYRLINRLITLGLDRRWRRSAARAGAASGGRRWLDVCSGTGEMAAELAALAPVGTGVFAADFSPQMTAAARARAELARVRFTLAAVPALPFPDRTFDLVTSAFATRNLETGTGDLAACFRELLRVLVPGGRLVVLETSQPRVAPVRWLLHLFTRLWVVPAGWLSASPAAYVYLASSMRSFRGRDALARLIGEAGFAGVGHRAMALGAVAVHTATRPK